MTLRERLSGLLSRGLVVFLAIIIGLLVIRAIATNFFYIFEVVEEQQIGVQFRGGRISDVVSPGIYSDFGLFVKMERVSTQAIPFGYTDPEIITKDKQRIGLSVSGDIFRPTAQEKDTIRTSWSQYKGIYTDDELARARITDFARQSMKVCVGDRTFDDNIIGTARDALRQCIDDELNILARDIGLNVDNLVVPEVVLGEKVQEALDAIVQSRLSTEKAAQDELKANAEAAAEQARQEGEIRVEQSRIQEQTRQQTLLALLEQERLEAQLAIIEAQRENTLAELETNLQQVEAQKGIDLLAAERDLEINLALAEAAKAKAEAEVAVQNALAELYAANPAYVQLLIVEQNARALNETDKLIFTQEGLTPTLVLPGPGIVPTVDTTPTENVPASTADTNSATIDSSSSTP